MAMMCFSAICAPMAAAQNWTLVWSDEFNGPAGSAPSGADWNFVLGKNNANGELEFYCPPGNNNAPCSAAHPNIFEDGNGNLVISAHRNPTRASTSGRSNTAEEHPIQ